MIKLAAISFFILLATVETLCGKGYAMDNKDKNLSPKGVLYFSNGVSIEKLNLLTKKRQVVIPEHDELGESTHSLYPVHSVLYKKVYFLRQYAEPGKNHVVIYDLESRNIESKINLPDSLSLSG